MRTFTVGGRDVIDGFGVDERATDGRGQVLAPWPNRLTDGRYRYGDRDCQAPLNEVSRHTAIHGLVRWLDWSLVAHDPTSVTLSCAVRPAPGYEWQLDLQITYALSQAGLIVTFQARQRRQGTGPVRCRVPSLPHARHGTRRRTDADRAGDYLSRAGQSERRAGDGRGRRRRLRTSPAHAGSGRPSWTPPSAAWYGATTGVPSPDCTTPDSAPVPPLCGSMTPTAT